MVLLLLFVSYYFIVVTKFVFFNVLKGPRYDWNLESGKGESII